MTCGYIPPGWAFKECTACPLPDKHEGPHRSMTEEGFVQWMKDPSCTCKDCLESDDPTDACIAWGHVDQ